MADCGWFDVRKNDYCIIFVYYSLRVSVFSGRNLAEYALLWRKMNNPRVADETREQGLHSPAG